MNTITFELCAEDRARLDNIIKALQGLTITAIKNEQAAADAVAPVETKKAEPKQEAPAPAKEEPAEQPKAAAPEPKTEAVPEVSAAELQSKVVQLVSAGKKTETRAIVMEYAKSVGEIPADKRAEVLERLKALEG